MKLHLWVFLLGSCAALNAQATCTQSPESGTPVPHIFNVSDFTVNIDADAPADTSKSVTYTDSPVQGYKIRYDECHTGDMFGKTALNLTSQGAAYIYPSNIPGIGIKILYNNGSAFGTGQFPTSGTMDFSSKGGDVGSTEFDPGDFYRIEVYKTAETLNLNPLSMNIALTPNNYAYNWITSDSLANAAQILHIGNIQIVSTPSCSFENSKSVDFGTVTGDMLNSGAQVDRALDFSITCRTDYGSYSTTASLSSEAASTDSGYINVTDSSGAKDALAIKVVDGQGTWLKLDGSNSETVSNIASNVPTEFHWKTTLMAQPGAKKHPAEGNFTAHAEILLQVK